MKAIGIDCWVPTQEEQIKEKEEAIEAMTKNGCAPEENSFSDTKIPDVVAQEELQKYLQKIAIELNEVGYQIIQADENHFRVLAPEDQLPFLNSVVGHLVFEIDSRMHYMVVPEGTPLEQCAEYDENLYAGIEDFANYCPTRDELVELAKYWRMEMLTKTFYNSATGGALDYDDDYFFEHPKARLARIEKLIGKEAIDKAMQEVEVEYKRIYPVRWALLEHDSTYEFQAYHHAYPRGTETEFKNLKETINRIADDMPLDENQKKILEEIGLPLNSRFIREFCLGLEVLINRDLYLLCDRLK